MKILDLPLMEKWYDMYEAGIKKEEYREMTTYWAKRFLWWLFDPALNYDYEKLVEELKRVGVAVINDSFFGDIEFAHYTHVRLRYGYTKRTMLFELKNIDIGKGNPDWGAPDHEVFILKLGDRIE